MNVSVCISPVTRVCFLYLQSADSGVGHLWRVGREPTCCDTCHRQRKARREVGRRFSWLFVRYHPSRRLFLFFVVPLLFWLLLHVQNPNVNLFNSPRLEVWLFHCLPPRHSSPSFNSLCLLIGFNSRRVQYSAHAPAFAGAATFSFCQMPDCCAEVDESGDSLPVTPIYSSACFTINDELISVAAKEIAQWLSHFMANLLMLFSYKYKSSFC